MQVTGKRLTAPSHDTDVKVADSQVADGEAVIIPVRVESAAGEGTLSTLSCLPCLLSLPS